MAPAQTPTGIISRALQRSEADKHPRNDQHLAQRQFWLLFGVQPRIQRLREARRDDVGPDGALDVTGVTALALRAAHASAIKMARNGSP